MLSSRGSSRPRDQTHVSLCFLHWQAGRFFTTSATWEAPPGTKEVKKRTKQSCLRIHILYSLALNGGNDKGTNRVVSACYSDQGVVPSFKGHVPVI